MAKRLGRRWIGLEREHAYADLAARRIASVEEAPEKELLYAPTKRQAPRVPFGWLVERGLLRPGSTLHDLRRRHSARVRADGTLIAQNALGDHAGSIHQVGAAVQGLPACNGWTFWHFEQGHDLAPIDLLRQKLIQEMNQPSQH